MVEEIPVPFQRIHTDHGREFFAYWVQERLREWSIKFRPIRPRAPDFNGKVEWVRPTALEEFWSTIGVGEPELVDRLAERQHFYNWARPHDSLGGHAPIERVCNLRRRSPTGGEIAANCDPNREFILPRNDWPTVTTLSLKRCRQITHLRGLARAHSGAGTVLVSIRVVTPTVVSFR